MIIESKRKTDNKISSLFISDLAGSESSGKEIKRSRKKRNGKGDEY